MNSKPKFQELTNFRTYFSSGIILISGTILLIIAEQLTPSDGRLWLKSVISNLGGLLVASVSIATLWELFSKRAFLDELLAKTGLAEDIRSVGLTGISLSPVRGPDFSSLIRSAERLDIFVCYANTWRASFEKDLKQMATKKNCRIRLIVPNPDNQALMEELANRFSADSHQAMAIRIRQAITDYKEIFASAKNSSLDFSVWIHDKTPLTSFYRFDRCAVVTLYKHATGRGDSPTLIAERRGTLYSFLEKEIDAMIKGIDPHPALARQIFTTRPTRATPLE